MSADPHRFIRTPYFEHPGWFSKPVFNEEGKLIKPSANYYYNSKIKTAGVNLVFMLEEEARLQGSETTVIFDPDQTFCLYFDENPANRFNRQYVETEDGKWHDITLGWTLIVGDRFRSSKIKRILNFDEFCEYLSTNKHDSVLRKLLTI